MLTQLQTEQVNRANEGTTVPCSSRKMDLRMHFMNMTKRDSLQFMNRSTATYFNALMTDIFPYKKFANYDDLYNCEDKQSLGFLVLNKMGMQNSNRSNRHNTWLNMHSIATATLARSQRNRVRVTERWSKGKTQLTSIFTKSNLHLLERHVLCPPTILTAFFDELVDDGTVNPEDFVTEEGFNPHRLHKVTWYYRDSNIDERNLGDHSYIKKCKRYLLTEFHKKCTNIRNINDLTKSDEAFNIASLLFVLPKHASEKLVKMKEQAPGCPTVSPHVSLNGDSISSNGGPDNNPGINPANRGDLESTTRKQSLLTFLINCRDSALVIKKLRLNEVYDMLFEHIVSDRKSNPKDQDEMEQDSVVYHVMESNKAGYWRPRKYV